jgi:2,3-bisphosphoglycerate-dependent phosphoglycerate mutase
VRSGVLILLRHGESTANAEDLFGGQLDYPLTDRGRAQAADAGRLIRAAGLLPAAVHTSMLSRAVQTAALTLAAADATHARIRHDSRLDERHYGRLQGRSRPSVRAELGDELFDRVRRSYDTAAPGGESLAEVAGRVQSYWHAAVLADLRAGDTTLVVAHGNTLRALCMYLDALTPTEVARLNIPTGVPLRYDLDEASRPRVRGGVYLDTHRAAAGIAEVAAQGGPRRSLHVDGCA